MRRLWRVSASAIVALGASMSILPATAGAAERWTSPSATATSGSCSALMPCRIDHAVNAAEAIDVVVVMPGTYAVTTALEPTKPIDLHGVFGEPRPRLVGDPKLNASTLTFKDSATVSHLAIEATASGQDALTLRGGTGERLLLSSVDGDAAKVVGAPGATLLRDSVAWTRSGDGGAAALKLRDGPDGGGVRVVNVTAIATSGDADGVRCETDQGESRILNSVVRGAAADVDATPSDDQGQDGGGDRSSDEGSSGNEGPGSTRCSASYSNLRPSLSPGVASGEGNQDEDPVFFDAADGDFHPVAGSPTIDAGFRGFASIRDLDGRERSNDAEADMGAYEYDPGYAPPTAPGTTGTTGTSSTDTTGATNTTGTSGTGTTGTSTGSTGDSSSTTGGPDTTTTSSATATTGTATGAPGPSDDAPAGPTPQLGASVVVAPATGAVLVKLPGDRGFAPLPAAHELPVGSTIDVRRGSVTLVSALDAQGSAQSATFRGGIFQVRQSPTGRGMTDIVLRRDLRCGRRPARGRRASASGRRRRTNRLWAKDRGGRFRTHGRNSVATVRGTEWLTEDRCDGTLTRVVEGKVAVRDRRRGRTVTLRAGLAYLARARR